MDNLLNFILRIQIHVRNTLSTMANVILTLVSPHKPHKHSKYTMVLRINFINLS